MEQHPPKLPLKLLKWFCREDLLETIEGDLCEEYQDYLDKYGQNKANRVFYWTVFRSMRPYLFKKKFVHPFIRKAMLKNNLKVATRNMVSNKSASFLNILCLSIGIASFLVISIYVAHQLSYDRFHKDVDSIHRVVIDMVDANGNRLPDATTPPALAYALEQEMPEVQTAINIFPGWGTNFLFGVDEKQKFYEKDWIRTDSLFFDVFSFPLKYGNPNNVLKNKSDIVITKRIALKYFGREDVIGETITLFREEDRVFQISGVLEDIPANSHFHFDFLSRLDFDNIEENWGWYNYYTYIKLSENTSIASLEPKLQPFFEKHQEKREYYNIVYSQPLTSIHLNSHLKWELGKNGDITNIYILSILAVFVLILSCLNYLNLAIARFTKRFREVGVRKVLGAGKKSIILQFQTETLLFVVVSLCLGSILSETLFALLPDLMGNEFTLLSQENLPTYLLICGVVILIGILAGLYPSVYLSSYKPVDAIKGVFGKSGNTAKSIRNSLLVVQFFISAFMIFGTLTVYKQVKFLMTKDKGFNAEQVLMLENTSAIEAQQVFKNELTKLPSVKSAGFTNGVIGGLNWTFRIGYPDPFLMNYVVTDPEFMETMGFEFIGGRNFSAARETDTQGLTLIVNETGLKELGLTMEDVGENLPLFETNDTTIERGTIIGVVKDFRFTDFKSEIKHFAFFYRQDAMPNLGIRVDTQNLSSTLGAIDDLWSKYSDGRPFEYFFLDEKYEEHIEGEKRLSEILFYLSAIAFLIAFIGMFALASINIKTRLKEIALRKTLGASSFSVTNLILVKFLKLVLLANLIACPLAFIVAEKWLQGFVDRITLEIPIFVITIASTFIIAWATVGFQSVKAALSNPVSNLRE